MWSRVLKYIPTGVTARKTTLLFRLQSNGAFEGFGSQVKPLVVYIIIEIRRTNTPPIIISC